MANYIKGKLSAHFYGILGIVVSLAGIGLTVVYSSMVNPTIDTKSQQYVLAKESDVKAHLDRLLSSDTIVIEKPHINRKNVDSVEIWGNEGYEVFEKSHTWDLREWRRVQSVDLSQPKSPATVKTRLLVKKTSESNQYGTIAMTSGFDIYSRCETPKNKCSVLAGNKKVTAGGNILKPRLIQVDTSDYTENSEIDVTTVSTYWNAFQNQDQIWIGTTVRERIHKVTLLVILPDKKLFGDYTLSVAELESDKKFAYSGKQLILGDPDRRYIYWEILNPVPGHVYRIDWVW